MLYLSLVFPPCELTTKRLQRTLFEFIWSSKFEKVKRQIMHKPHHLGGKDVPNIKLFLYSKFFSLCFKNLTAFSPWAHFLRYAARHIFRKRKWVSISQTGPVLLSPPKQYLILEKAIRTYDLETFDIDTLKNPRKLLQQIKSKETMTPISYYSYNRTASVWKLVNAPYLTNQHKDLSWMIVHECLPTRDFQYRRRLSNMQTCPRNQCNSDETTMHLIWNCDFAQQVWKECGELIKFCSGLTFLNHEIVLHAILPNLNKEKERVLLCTLSCIKSALWKTRNILLFKRDYIIVRDCIRLALSELYMYYLLDMKKLGKKRALSIWNFHLWKMLF
ncbi:unnamed protein product [Ranitomeya imitator]|uniref:Reverse transcriptase zinc-binding domain-containing protein n=1 Tax=Ranitomeya imitator TaxID=111125 RepID=A0ABN9KWP8_9NEOB|nr:unnamed protein product [Ranitomeya imitator]